MIARERAVELRAHLTDGERWTAYHDEDAGRPCVDSAARGDHRSRFIVAEVCSDSAEDAALIAAAPDLAATVVALSDELARLRTVVEGRSTAPTDEAMREHMDAGGAWLVTIPARKQVRIHPETRYVDSPREASLLWWTEGARWVAVRDGRPCAWPTTSEGDAAGEAGRGTGGEGRGEAVAAMRERCAAACDDIANDPESTIEESRSADHCAEVIRALPTMGGEGR